MKIESNLPPIPKKLGVMKTVNAETGEVVKEQRNAFTLLPPAPNVCQVCAVDHVHDQPHNQQSMYYQMRFHAEHGRWPTWSDAMAHCDDQTKQAWRSHLIELMREKGIDVPEDLLAPKPVGR